MLKFKIGEVARIRNDVPNKIVRNKLVKINSASETNDLCQTVFVNFLEKVADFDMERTYGISVASLSKTSSSREEIE